MAWLAQRTDKTTITTLLRVSWEAVARIVATVVADQLDDARLDDLYRIGVDEVSYRKVILSFSVDHGCDLGGRVEDGVFDAARPGFRSGFGRVGSLWKSDLLARRRLGVAGVLETGGALVSKRVGELSA